VREQPNAQCSTRSDDSAHRITGARLRTLLFVVPAVLAAGMTGGLAAQAPKAAFEVVSVKRRAEPVTLAGNFPQVRPGGVFHPTNVTVAALIKFAYDIKDFQLIGGPAWIHDDLFDVDARAGSDAPVVQVRLMVQSLLEDRFRLMGHTEPRDLRYLALVPARRDGTLGPWLVRLPDDCNAAAALEAAQALPPRARPSAGATIGGRCSSISGVADLATRVIGTPVIDRTGLTGMWYFEVFFAPDARLDTAGDPNLAPFAIALHEQLGLALESARGSIEVFVIGSVQPPTDN
jgi:uncharacterized protein (TIGR03435 family)